MYLHCAHLLQGLFAEILVQYWYSRAAQASKANSGDTDQLGKTPSSTVSAPKEEPRMPVGQTQAINTVTPLERF